MSIDIDATLLKFRLFGAGGNPYCYLNTNENPKNASYNLSVIQENFVPTSKSSPISYQIHVNKTLDILLQDHFTD